MYDRRSIRRSRADCVWALALFAASQLALAVAIEFVLPELRDPRYACRVAKLQPRTAAVQPRPLAVVMLGSSRVQDGFNAGEIETRLGRRTARPLVLYNFGVPGAGPLANLIHFERLRRAGVKPDLLLIEINPFLLADQDGAPAEAKYFTADRLWRRELPLVEQGGMTAKSLWSDWWQDWPVPCHGHRFAIVSWIMPQLLPLSMRLVGDRRVDRWGWNPRNTAPLTPEERRLALGHTWSGFGEGLKHFQLSQAACEVQRRLLRRCREDEIAAALVWMPEGDLLRSWYPPTVEAQIRGFIERLVDEFSVPLVDARDWVAEEGFIDSNHLHASGAGVFSQRLGRDVLEPILALPAGEWAGYLASHRSLGNASGRASVARQLNERGEEQVR